MRKSVCCAMGLWRLGYTYVYAAHLLRQFGVKS